MDDKTSKLFPEINPNVEELIERDNAIDAENVIIEKPVEKTTEKDMFVKKKNKKVVFKDEEGEKNVEMKVEEKPIVKKDKYAHLKAARQKGIETRRRKAAERKALKEAEKLKKQEEKEARKKATMERNREKARQRYYKEKEKKKSIPQKIVQATQPKGITQIRQQASMNNMDFNTFAKYMMKYENMKEAYNKQKKQEIEKKAVKKAQQKQQSYHSQNYPLAHLYNPNFRNKEYTF
mgnify:CR=1 FL=1|jgi:hypothetical protein